MRDDKLAWGLAAVLGVLVALAYYFDRTGQAAWSRGTGLAGTLGGLGILLWRLRRRRG